MNERKIMIPVLTLELLLGQFGVKENENVIQKTDWSKSINFPCATIL